MGLELYGKLPLAEHPESGTESATPGSGCEDYFWDVQFVHGWTVNGFCPGHKYREDKVERKEKWPIGSGTNKLHTFECVCDIEAGSYDIRHGVSKAPFHLLSTR